MTTQALQLVHQRVAARSVHERKQRHQSLYDGHADFDGREVTREQDDAVSLREGRLEVLLAGDIEQPRAPPRIAEPAERHLGDTCRDVFEVPPNQPSHLRFRQRREANFEVAAHGALLLDQQKRQRSAQERVQPDRRPPWQLGRDPHPAREQPGRPIARRPIAPPQPTGRDRRCCRPVVEWRRAQELIPRETASRCRDRTASRRTRRRAGRATARCRRLALSSTRDRRARSCR